jgi:hypothetical protein
MRFSDLRDGDVFQAFGQTFQKASVATPTPELPDANAINMDTGRVAFFGATVPVELLMQSSFEPRDGPSRRPA